MVNPVGGGSYKNIKPDSGREWYHARPPRGPRILMVDVPAGTELVDSGQRTGAAS